MKHILLLISLFSFTGLCLAVEMPQSAKEIGCSNCHAIDHKVVGPSWIDVSKRYRAMRGEQDTFDQLVQRISKGGEGNWGDVPMVATDPAGTKRERIVELVNFILALSDQLPESKNLLSENRKK